MTEPLTLMAVHAHPDDEASSTGGVLAHYSAQGVRTVVVTCTNGEFGDATGGVKPGAEGHDPELVAKTRLVELEAACEALGVTHLERLGYHDSGMPDWAFKDDAHVFWNTPVEEASARLAALFDTYRPQVVVTYDENGGYGHPDHVQAHRVTVAAVDANPVPAKLYFTARRRRDLDGMREALAAQGIELPTRRPLTPEQQRRAEEREARVTTSVDVAGVAHRKYAALAAHASQAQNIRWLQMPPEAFAAVFAYESFIRVRDTTGAPVPEDDLFAGLR